MCQHLSIFIYKWEQQGLTAATPRFSLEQDGFLCPLRAARDRSAQVGAAPLCSGVLLRSALTDHWVLPSESIRKEAFLLYLWPAQHISLFGFDFHRLYPEVALKDIFLQVFTNSLLGSRQLLKAPLRCQSCTRAGRRQAGER